MTPRGSNGFLPSTPLLWLVGTMIVVLIGPAYVRSEGGSPVKGTTTSRLFPATPSPAPTAPTTSGERAPALSAGRPAPPARTRALGQVALSSNSNTAQVPRASPPAAGIRVTGIARGRAYLAIIEMGGLSYVAGVGDRIGDFTVMAISGNAVVLRQRDRTFRLSLARAENPPATAEGAPPAVAIPAAAPSAAPPTTPMIASSPAAKQPTKVPTPALPSTVTVESVSLGPTGYPTQTTIPVWGVPLAPVPPSPPVLSPNATLYTPSGTSAYGSASAPITTQSTISLRGVTALPVAFSKVQSGAPVVPPGATLYTPSGTSAYGSTSTPITAQSEISLRGVTALPVASNQAQTVAQVLPRPTSGQAGAAVATTAMPAVAGGGTQQTPGGP
jgi:hypothetical protein